MPPLHPQTSVGNGNLQKRCEIVASPPLTLEKTLGGAIASSFLCFSRHSSDVEFRGGVCGVGVSLPARRGAREWEAGRAVGKNCTPSHGAGGSGEQRGAPERGRETGEWKFTAACERLCVFQPSFLLTLSQRLTVARQKKSGRPSP